MPSFDSIVLSGSDWNAAATIQLSLGASGGGFFVVENAKVYYSLQFGPVQQGQWTDAYPLGIGTGQIPGGVTGIRFKNFDATAPATVTAAIAPPNQPIVGLTTQGQATSTMITGIVAANGSIVAGSGFSVNHSGAGTYVVTFTTAFGSRPVIVANGEDLPNGFAYLPPSLSAISSAGFTLIWKNSAGSGQDTAFGFVAEAVV